ncbi:MAG: hypothetical protein KAU21_14795, partial [Gammaproteobacteria bacterium]|nr:hypothetical protein [Gammaproteobacteria bacterium]
MNINLSVTFLRYFHISSLNLFLSHIFMSLIHYEYKQSKLFWLILILAVVTLFEVFLISVSTGYLPTKVSFLLWDRFDYFIVYFRNEPFEALSLYFIDKPLFKIEAMQEAP